MSVAVVAGCKGCGASRFQVPFDLYRTTYCVKCAKAVRREKERSKKPKRIHALRAIREHGNVPPADESLDVVFLTGEARMRQRQADRDADAMERWAARGFSS